MTDNYKVHLKSEEDAIFLNHVKFNLNGETVIFYDKNGVAEALYPLENIEKVERV